MTATAPEAPAPLPDGVLGYTVAWLGIKPSLTHSTLLSREEAETEKRQWQRSRGPGMAGKYIVCEVREAA